MAEAKKELIEQLRDNLVCHICAERKELRLLPCQNTVCLSCLSTIVSTAEQQRLPPTCPYCREELKLSPSAYPICRMAADFEKEFDRLGAAIKEFSLHDEILCETDGCTRPIDWYCNGCQEFICTRCSRKLSCTGSDSTHQLVDFEKLKEESCKKFQEWKEIKEMKIHSLESARTQMAFEMREQIAGASNDTVAEVYLKHDQLKTPHQILALKSLEEGERAVLNYYSTGISQVSDVDYIRLVQQMNFIAPSYEKATLNHCQVMMNKTCYSVTEGSYGHLLIGRKGGFDILDREGELIRDIEVYKSNTNSVQEYNGYIYALCAEYLSSPKRHVIVFDNSNYEEIRKWQVADYKYISQLAVANDKVYVSDTENSRLCVYPVDYRTSILPFLKRSPAYIADPTFSTPECLACCTKDFIAVSNYRANKVHMKCLEGGTTKWTNSTISNPRGICCGIKQDVWVWSGRSKSLFRLSAHSGELKEEVTHPMFSKSFDEENILNMCFTSGGRFLWVAARKQGLLRFTVEYS